MSVDSSELPLAIDVAHRNSVSLNSLEDDRAEVNLDKGLAVDHSALESEVAVDGDAGVAAIDIEMTSAWASCLDDACREVSIHCVEYNCYNVAD